MKSGVRLLSVMLLGALGCTAARSQSNPPVPFAAVPVSEAPTKALQVVGDYLFVAAWGRGVQVLDISEPTRPKWAGGWNPRKCAMGVHVVGNYAYVANRRAGLSVLDVRNPASPILVGTATFPGDAVAVNVSGHYAYVADYPTGFRIFDVKDPSHPVLLGTGPMPQAPVNIHAVGDFACFTEPNGFHVFDVRDRSRPVRLASRQIFGSGFRVQIVGHHAYVATGQTGLLILDLSNPASPQPIDALMSETNNLPIVIRSSAKSFQQIGYTWMLTNAGLRDILAKKYEPNTMPDIAGIVESLRDSPSYADVRVRQTQIPRRLHGLHVLDHYALALSAGLEVIDLSDVTRPRRVGGCDLGGLTYDVRGAGRYAYVMDNGANIRVFDLGEPTRQVEVARFEARGFASPVLAASEASKPVVLPPQETYADVPVVTGPPELVEPKRLPDGVFAFTLAGAGGATYVVQASSDLASWATISTNTLPPNGRLQIADADAAAQAHRFYRAVSQ